jgi:hypothetical protein
MSKVLCASITALLIAGNLSAFAVANTYTDLDSGFKSKSQPAWMEIGGRNFYGLANKPDNKDTALNIICAYTAKEVEEATGKKFSTDEFLKKYKDLQVLERNGLSPDKVNYLLFMPDPYEIKTGNKLSLAPKELLDNSNISISTNKNGKQPYVYLHIVDNGDKEKEKVKSLGPSIDMQIAVTSANNMLYAVVSTFPLPNLKAQKEKIEEATPFSKKKVRGELTDGNKEKVNGYIASRKAFLKGLTFFTPAKSTVPYGFDDQLLGGRIRIPEDWAYVQANDDTIDKNIPVKITLAMPWNGVSDFLTYQAETNKTPTEKDISKINFQKIKEVALFASSRTKEKTTFAELFNNPVLTNLLIDKFIKEGANHPSVKEFVDFKDVNAKSDFGDSYGTIRLTGHGITKNNFLINVNARAMFTPQNFGLAAYISKDNKKMDASLEKILGNIKLLKK